MIKPSLCLNMIVKNEADRIERCLASVLPYVRTVAILDTGSTDDTCKIITRVCAEYNVKQFTHAADFKNFSQARNDAFAFAQRCNGGPLPFCQFALLMDADMELVVTDQNTFLDLDARALSYDMMQKAGAVSYANRRVLNLTHVNDTPYIGVTHEYIDVPAMGMITGASFVDHADGSNRVNKFERDAVLLEEALLTEPNNGRYLYYLGNSYRDWGALDPLVLPFAENAYVSRIALGGWEEETHSAMMHLASVRKDRKNAAGFVAGMVEAYNFRPSRAEPLYDLAKYFREKGDNPAALLFAEAGLNKKRPDDLLFVNDFVYSHGLRYEYSIAAFYDPEKRDRAFEITDALALDPTCPAGFRNSARQNLFWYTRPLSYYCSSFRPTQLAFTPPAGYTAMNPSVEACNGNLRCNVRCVNYKIDEHGRYMIGPKECNDAPIDTRNFIVDLSDDLSIKRSRELLWHREPPRFNMVTGLEDIRLWNYCGDLHFNATVREHSLYGTCQQIQGKIMDDGMDEAFCTVQQAEIMSGDVLHEKNWMPMPSRRYSRPRFIYRLDTLITPGDSEPTEKFSINVAPDNISGSSQAIPFKGGLLAVVHEAVTDPAGKRTYWHRFASFDREGQLGRLSKPFVFFDRQIEFCAGLAYHLNHRDLIISFGVKDAEAWVATVAIEEVAMMLGNKQ